MRVSFQPISGTVPAVTTSFQPCHPSATMNFEIAGMYASTGYNMFTQTDTGGVITNGPTVTFETGALPGSVPFPPVRVVPPSGSGIDTADSLFLLSTFQGAGVLFPNIATDLSGAVLWYYYPSAKLNSLLTRPLADGTMLVLQDGPAWNPAAEGKQLLHQIDLAGNVKRETNTGILQQELLALGAKDAAPCNIYPSPAPVGAACLGAFHHDAIQTLPNGYTAVFVDIEKIFPAGTQGDTSGLPVDIIGDMIVVLDQNWQAVWYFDAFEHASGGPQLDINRPAVLGETCVVNERGCPPMFLLGTGIAPAANDWLHGNSIYYWPQTGDIIWSSRHQDWVMKMDYSNGAGTGNILWRLGPCGDFTFDNIYDDPWPWNSHQHDVGLQNNGAGPLTLFDNGDTRISPPTGPGSSTGCMPGVGSGDSRGMALGMSETGLEITPVMSQDLGYYSQADGSAQLLGNGNYFFLAGVAIVSISTVDSFSIELQPITGTAGGTQMLNLQGPEGYRAWRMPSLYTPPIT
jgi:hypothetical protein